MLTTADIIDRVGRNGQAILTGALVRGALHDAVDTFYNIIDIGKVTAHIAVVKDLYLFSCHKLFRLAEIEHIRSSSRTIDCKEAQACRGDVVKLAVSMSQQLIALLGSSVEAHGVIHFVVGTEWNLFVAAVDR